MNTATPQSCYEQCADMAKRIRTWTAKHKKEPVVVQWNCQYDVARHSTVSHAISHDLIICSEPAKRMIQEAILPNYGPKHEPTVVMLRTAFGIAFPKTST